MRLRIWRSFASNNSASFYIVATFTSVNDAVRSASNLRAYLDRNEEELAAMTARERRANQDLTLANLELSEALGFEWPTQIADGYADNTDFQIETVGPVVAIYHDNCLGFTPELARYFEVDGASVSAERVDKQPVLSLLAWRPKDDTDVGHLDELEIRFKLDGHLPVQSFYARESEGSSFRTPRVAGFVGAISMFELPNMLRLVQSAPFSDHHIALDRAGDVGRFSAISKAGCAACGSRDLDIVFEGEHESAQKSIEGTLDLLACHDCGGMFGVDD